MKLVRDFIPQIIEGSGGKCKWRYTTGREEFFSMLENKIVEETGEFLDAVDYDHVVMEAGDVLEVVYTLFRLRGVSIADAEQARIEKYNSRGGFAGGIVLEKS